MSKVRIQGNASGSGVFTLTTPNSGTDRTITLPDASGTLAFTTDDDDKMPLAGGAFTGAVTTNSTFDGRDVAADGVLATNALPKGGGTMTGTTVHGDNIKDTYGAGADLEIYHDGSHNRLQCPTGELKLRASAVRIGSVAGENGINMVGDGAVELYHNNAKRIDTNGGGIGIYSSTPALSWKEQDGATKMDINFGANATDTAEWNVHPAKDIRFRNNSTTTFTLKSDGRGLSQFTAKFWCTWTQVNSHAIGDSHNISSISDSAVGRTVLNFANNMAQAQYVVNVTGRTGAFGFDNSRAVGSVDVGFRNAGDSAEDTANAMCVGYGD